MSTLLRMTREHVPAEEISILLYNPRTQALETREALGRHAEASRAQVLSLQENRGITRWVAEHKQSVRVANVHRDAPCVIFTYQLLRTLSQNWMYSTRWRRGGGCAQF